MLTRARRPITNDLHAVMPVAILPSGVHCLAWAEVPAWLLAGSCWATVSFGPLAQFILHADPRKGTGSPDNATFNAVDPRKGRLLR